MRYIFLILFLKIIRKLYNFYNTLKILIIYRTWLIMFYILLIIIKLINNIKETYNFYNWVIKIIGFFAIYRFYFNKIFLDWREKRLKKQKIKIKIKAYILLIYMLLFLFLFFNCEIIYSFSDIINIYYRTLYNVYYIIFKDIIVLILKETFYYWESVDLNIWPFVWLRLLPRTRHIWGETVMYMFIYGKSEAVLGIHKMLILLNTNNYNSYTQWPHIWIWFIRVWGGMLDMSVIYGFINFEYSYTYYFKIISIIHVNFCFFNLLFMKVMFWLKSIFFFIMNLIVVIPFKILEVEIWKIFGMQGLIKVIMLENYYEKLCISIWNEIHKRIYIQVIMLEYILIVFNFLWAYIYNFIIEDIIKLYWFIEYMDNQQGFITFYLIIYYNFIRECIFYNLIYNIDILLSKFNILNLLFVYIVNEYYFIYDIVLNLNNFMWSSNQNIIYDVQYDNLFSVISKKLKISGRYVNLEQIRAIEFYKEWGLLHKLIVPTYAFLYGKSKEFFVFNFYGLLDFKSTYSNSIFVLFCDYYSYFDYIKRKFTLEKVLKYLIYILFMYILNKYVKVVLFRLKSIHYLETWRFYYWINLKRKNWDSDLHNLKKYTSLEYESLIDERWRHLDRMESDVKEGDEVWREFKEAIEIALIRLYKLQRDQREYINYSFRFRMDKFLYKNLLKDSLLNYWYQDVRIYKFLQELKLVIILILVKIYKFLHLFYLKSLFWNIYMFFKSKNKVKNLNINNFKNKNYWYLDFLYIRFTSDLEKKNKLTIVNLFFLQNMVIRFEKIFARYFTIVLFLKGYFFVDLYWSKYINKQEIFESNKISLNWKREKIKIIKNLKKIIIFFKFFIIFNKMDMLKQKREIIKLLLRLDDLTKFFRKKFKKQNPITQTKYVQGDIIATFATWKFIESKEKEIDIYSANMKQSNIIPEYSFAYFVLFFWGASIVYLISMSNHWDYGVFWLLYYGPEYLSYYLRNEWGLFGRIITFYLHIAPQYLFKRTSWDGVGREPIIDYSPRRNQFHKYYLSDKESDFYWYFFDFNRI